MREDVLRSLLLVDADLGQRRMVSATASRAGWSVVSAACPETAAGLLQGPHGREVRASLLSSWDAASGPALIAAMRAIRPDLPVIVLAEGGSIDQAVEAMRAGASDFLAKPVAAERLLEALSAHRDRRRAAGELAPLSEKLAPELPLEELVGATPDFRAALAVAAADVAVDGAHDLAERRAAHAPQHAVPQPRRAAAHALEHRRGVEAAERLRAGGVLALRLFRLRDPLQRCIEVSLILAGAGLTSTSGAGASNSSGSCVSPAGGNGDVWGVVIG